MRPLVLIMVLGAWIPRLNAQGTVVLPEAPLDSARAALRDDLLTFRDSLSSVDAAAARLHRDYRQASEAVLRSRARVMTEACTRSVRNVPRARLAIQVSEASSDTRRRARRELLGALDRLSLVLNGCQKEFGALSGPGKGEEVRGYGNNRAIRIQSGLREYEQALARFLSAMGIKAALPGSRSPAVPG
jgi:hypothetical protein